MDLRQLACWDLGFESHRGMNICLFRVVCCLLEVPATGRSPSRGVWVTCTWMWSGNLKKKRVLNRPVATKERNCMKTQNVFLIRDLGDWIRNRACSDIHKLHIFSTNITGFYCYNLRTAYKKYLIKNNFWGQFMTRNNIEKGIIFLDQARLLRYLI